MTNALRPLTVGELLDRTFYLYRRHFLLFVGIAAVPNLFLLAFQLFDVVVSPTSLGAAVAILWFMASIFVFLVTISVSQGATIIAVSRVQLERETSASDTFAAIRSRIGELAAVIVGMGVRILIGFLFLIIPGIYLAIVWSLAIPAAVLEKLNLGDALQRSAELTRGHRGRIFIIYLLLLTLVYIVTLVVQVPTLAVVTIWGGALSDTALPAWAQIALAASSFLTNSLVSPIMTIALSLVYYDERVRKEAFDLEHMMEELDRAAAPFPAA